MDNQNQDIDPRSRGPAITLELVKQGFGPGALEILQNAPKNEEELEAARKRGLVITPETVMQGKKLLELDSNYIEGESADLPLQSYNDTAVVLPSLPKIWLGGNKHLGVGMERILRVVGDFGMLSIENIASITGYRTLNRVREMVNRLVGMGYLKDVGYVAQTIPSHEFNGRFYVPGKFNFKKNLPTYLGQTQPVVSQNRVKEWIAEFSTKAGFKIHEHLFFIAQATAWMMDVLNRYKLGNFIAYSERVLRKEFGWGRGQDNLDFEFRTYVPDAWIVHPKASFRLEFQHSKISNTVVKKVLAMSPEDELIVYVLYNSDMYKRFLSLEKQYHGRMIVCELGSETDEKRLVSAISETLKRRHPNRFREQVTRPEFYFLYKNVDPLQIFANKKKGIIVNTDNPSLAVKPNASEELKLGVIDTHLKKLRQLGLK